MNLIGQNEKPYANKYVIISSVQKDQDYTTIIKTDKFNLISELDGKISFDLDVENNVTSIEITVI